jgi:uncharacterized protein YqgC (DUF456 family)
MDVWLKIVGIAVLAAGLAGLFIPVLPGSVLLFAGVFLIAWADGFERIGIGTVVAVGILSAFAAVVDYLAGALGAKALGATKWGVIGAGLGLLCGLPFGFVGIILGPAAGAIAAEYLRNRDFRQSAKSGSGAVVGFAVGLVAKVALAFVILGIAAISYFR